LNYTKGNGPSPLLVHIFPDQYFEEKVKAESAQTKQINSMKNRKSMSKQISQPLKNDGQYHAKNKELKTTKTIRSTKNLNVNYNEEKKEHEIEDTTLS
jgi:hypothetical protein